MARAKKTKKIKVNMKGVESRVLLPEGEYPCLVHSMEVKTTDEKNKYIEWKFSVNSPDDNKLHGQITRPYNTSLQTQALWNLRNLLTTLGVEVPNGAMEIDPDEIIGLELIICIEHDSYEGKRQAKIADFMPIGGEDDDEDEDDEEVEVDDEDEEEDEEEDTDDEDDEDEDDEDDELDPVTEEEVKDMSVKELGELVEKYDLDIDLKDKKLKTAKKKIAAILKALEEEGYLADEDE